MHSTNDKLTYSMCVNGHLRQTFFYYLQTGNYGDFNRAWAHGITPCGVYKQILTFGPHNGQVNNPMVKR